MTTPTGGDDLTIRAGLSFDPASAEETARQAQRAGEQAARALAEGAAGTRVELPGVDTTAIYADIDRLVERVATASRNMSLRLSEGVAGGAGLMGQELRSAMADYQRLMENTVGTTVSRDFSGGFETALRRTLAMAERLGTVLQNVDARGRAIHWPMTEDARRFIDAGGERWSTSGAEQFTGGIQHGQMVPAPPRAMRPVVGELGDLERVRAEGMAAISRVVLDDATYAFENDQFFRTNAAGSVLRSKGAVDNPELQARLVAAQRAQFAAAQEQISRATLNQLASGDSGVSRFGMLPGSEYGRYGASGADLIPLVQQGAQATSAEVVNATVESLRQLGVELRDAPAAFNALNEALALLDVRLQATRQAALEATHGPLIEQTQRAMFTPAAIGTTEEEAQNSYLAQLRIRRQAADQAANDSAAQSLIYQARQRMLPGQFGPLVNQTLATMTGGAGGQPPFPPRTGGLGTSDEYDENAYLNALRQRALLTGEATRALIADTDAVLANARALSHDAGVTDEMVAAQRRLATLHPEMTTTGSVLGPQTELDAVARRQLLGAGSTVDGDVAARTGEGIALFNPESGVYKETISDTERLNREQAQSVETARAVAAANVEATRSYEELSQAELKAFIAQQDYNKAVAEQQETLARGGSPYERSEATLRRMSAEQNLVAANQATQAPKGFFGQAWQGLTMSRGSGEQGDNNAFLRMRSESGEFLGAIARYQAAYAVIFTVSRGFGALLSAEKASQEAMVEFGHATEMSGDRAQRFASDLGQITSAAGFGVGEAMQAATRGIFGFGDQVDAAGGGLQVRQQVGTTSAQAAAMASVVTGSKDIAATQAQVIAATRGFNFGFADQTRVLDAAANAARNYGGDLGGILQGLPQLATIAHQAGLSVEATSNIISLAMARGGQTGTTAASAIDRSLLAIDQPAARQTLGSLGVDTSGQSGQVLESLASKWKGLSAAQQDQAEKALGGVRAMKALLPVLQEGDGLLGANSKSYQNAGYFTELYYQKLNTLSGLIRTIGGDFKDLANDLANTGALDVFGVLLKTLHPFIEGLDDVAKMIDLIPSAMRPWIVNLLAISALLAVIGKQQAGVAAETAATGGGRILGLFGRRATTVASGPELGAAGLGVGGAATAEEEVATRNALGNLRAGAGAASKALIGPLGLTVGLVAATAAIGATVDAFHRINQADDQSTKARQQLAGARTADEFRSAASAESAAAVTERHASGGFFGTILNAAAGDATGHAARYDVTQAKYASSVADALDAQAKQTVQVTGDVTASLAQMASAGTPAVDQIRAVAAALHGLSTPGGVVPVLAGTASTGLAATAAQDALNPDLAKRLFGDHSKSINASNLDLLRSAISPSDTAKAIQQAESQLHIQAGATITDAQRQKIGDIAGGILTKQFASLGVGVQRTLHDAISGAISGSYAAQSTVKNPFSLSGTDLTAQWAALQPVLQQAIGQANPLQPDSQIGVLQANLAVIRQHLAAAKAKGDQNLVDTITLELNTETDQFVKDQIAKAERLRAAAVAAAGGDPAKVLAANVSAVRGEIVKAVRVGDISEVIAIIGTADKATMRAVNAAIALEYNVAEKSYEAAMAVYREAEANWSALPANLRQANPELAPVTPTQPLALRNARLARNAITAANAAGATTSDASANAVDPNALAESKILAGARPGDPVSQAKAQLDEARYALAHAKPGEYWTALKAEKDAEYAYAQAVNSHAHEVRLSGLDQTDPLAMAREDLRTATETLRSDRRKGTGDTTADEVAVQAARARAQAAAFSQRLSDVQTAHDLGRISDAAYLQWLTDQSKRLHLIHGKTRQQIDEMNQIDEALKAATDQMSGQWNLGNIKVPTAYEMRSFIAAQGGGTTHNTTQTVTINVTSAPEFDDVLARYFGPTTVSRVPTTQRRT